MNNMSGIIEDVFIMEGHFDQDNAFFEKSVKPSGGDLVSLSAKRIPGWIKKSTDDICSILALGDNWDSYGACRVSHGVAKAVNSLLIDIMRPDTPAPQMVPSASGSVQLEWHICGIDLEIEVESLSTACVYFSDENNEEGDWEGEVKYDFSALVRYINLLTDRVTNAS